MVYEWRKEVNNFIKTFGYYFIYPMNFVFNISQKFGDYGFFAYNLILFCFLFLISLVFGLIPVVVSFTFYMIIVLMFNRNEDIRNGTFKKGWK